MYDQKSFLRAFGVIAHLAARELGEGSGFGCSLLFSYLPTSQEQADAWRMGDSSVENEHLKEQLARVRRLVARHKEMGTNAESENRELRRKIELLKSAFEIYNKESGGARAIALKKVEEILSSM